MTRILTRKFKSSRRLSVNLWGSDKNPVLKRNYAPGEHGSQRTILSDYGKQLQEKQKLRKYYGSITESQFHSIYEKSRSKKGDTGETFIGLLESRLDAFVYRSGFASTMFLARQLVSHKHFKVNGKTVNIPSYTLKEGDVVQVRDKSKGLVIILDSIKNSKREIPEYIKFEEKDLSASLLKRPLFAEVPYPVVIDINLIIEFYSGR